MKTVLTLAAGACAAIGFASGASAATFDFTFYTESHTPPICSPTVGCAPEDYTEVGSGALSFDGEAEVGRTSLDELVDLAFSFNIAGSVFDQDDTAFSLGAQSLFIGSNGDNLHAYFLSSPPMMEVEVDTAVVNRPDACFSTYSILNDEGDCLNLGLSFGTTRVAADEEVILQSFSMIPALDDILVGAPQGADDPIFGRYLGRLSDDTAAVPLPASLPLLAFAIGGMGYLRSRRG